MPSVRSCSISSVSQRTSRSTDSRPCSLQLAGVAVQPLAGAGQGALHAVALLLDPAAPTLEDLQPDVGTGLAEERKPGAETLVVECLGADVGQQLGEVLLAFGGELVDTLAAPGTDRGTGRVERRLLGDPAGLGEPAQGRVERAVGERPEGPRAVVASRLRSS